MTIGLILAACGTAAPEPAPTEPAVSEPISPISPVPQEEDMLIDKPTGKLSPRLAALADPSVFQQDLEAQAEALGLPVSGTGSLMRNEAGDVLVYIRMADTSSDNQQLLTEAGAEIINVAEDYSTVTAYVNPQNLSALADLEVVESIREEVTP